MLLSLTNTPRPWAWGSRTLLAELEGREPSGAPEAEVWFGDHHADPSDLAGDGTLDSVTGGTLPYLLKLLAADEPLSIQVHPTRDQARAGWEREAGLDAADPRRNYRDDNHKPELLVVLSDTFESLSGLRPLDRTRELLSLLDDGAGVSALRSRLDGEDDALRGTLAWVLGEAPQSEIDQIISAARAAADRETGEWAPTLRAIARVADVHPGDAGTVVALLMNHLVLHRGEGLFLRAGLLHAYLSGLGVEIMAASDNVLRGGLTPKHIDVPELLAVVDTKPGDVPVLRPEADAEIAEYPVDVPDFALRRVSLSGAPVTLPVTGPTMVLATAGRVAVGGTSADEREVPVGTAVFVTADEGEMTISGRGEAFVATPGR